MIASEVLCHFKLSTALFYAGLMFCIVLSDAHEFAATNIAFSTIARSTYAFSISNFDARSGDCYVESQRQRRVAQSRLGRHDYKFSVSIVVEDQSDTLVKVICSNSTVLPVEGFWLAASESPSPIRQFALIPHGYSTELSEPLVRSLPPVASPGVDVEPILRDLDAARQDVNTTHTLLSSCETTLSKAAAAAATEKASYAAFMTECKEQVTTSGEALSQCIAAREVEAAQCAEAAAVCAAHTCPVSESSGPDRGLVIEAERDAADRALASARDRAEELKRELALSEGDRRDCARSLDRLHAAQAQVHEALASCQRGHEAFRAAQEEHHAAVLRRLDEHESWWAATSLRAGTRWALGLLRDPVPGGAEGDVAVEGEGMDGESGLASLSQTSKVLLWIMLCISVICQCVMLVWVSGFGTKKQG